MALRRPAAPTAAGRLSAAFKDAGTCFCFDISGAFTGQSRVQGTFMWLPDLNNLFTAVKPQFHPMPGVFSGER